MSIALSLFGIFFGLFLLIVLTYKGLHVSWVSILVAILIMVTSGLAITDTWNNAITAGIANIAGTMIPIYVAGATFGKLLSCTGAAESFASTILKLAKNWSAQARRMFAALLIIFMGILMSYAGIDNFAILFTQIAIAASLMNEVGIPRRFICVLIILGSTTGGMLPGTPNIINIWGAQNLGTTAMAAPILGVAGSAFIIVLSLLGLRRMWEKDIAGGAVFEYGPLAAANFDKDQLPPWFFLLIPVTIIFVCYNVLGISAFFALLVGLVVACVLLFPYLPKKAAEEGEKEHSAFIARLNTLVDSFNGGIELAGIPAIIIINQALGNLIAETPAFTWFCDLFSNVSGSPVVLFMIVSILIIGISASPSGMFVMYNLANSLFIPVLGLDVAFAHRAIGFAAAVLDTVPFGNMVVSLLLLTGIKQKDGYPPIGFATVGVTFLACVFVTVLALCGIR